jgi:hypothetical protein
MPDAAGMTREERVMLKALMALSSAVETGGATVLRVPEVPESPMLNRVVGLGVESAATEADVDEALAAMGTGVTFYVAVAPSARPGELPEWLRARGLEPGWGWMVFRRDVKPPASAATNLGVVEVDTVDRAEAFGHVVRASYELPETIEPRLARMRDAGWQCWVAFDGDEPAGAGALFAAESPTSVSPEPFPNTAARERRAPCLRRGYTVPLNSVATSSSQRPASAAATDRATPTATSCERVSLRTPSPRIGSDDPRA